MHIWTTVWKIFCESLNPRTESQCFTVKKYTFLCKLPKKNSQISANCAVLNSKIHLWSCRFNFMYIEIAPAVQNKSHWVCKHLNCIPLFLGSCRFLEKTFIPGSIILLKIPNVPEHKKKPYRKIQIWI